MNIISKWRFKRHSELFVRLAVQHYDKPTNLKQAMIDLELSSESLIESASDASTKYVKFPTVRADLQLACLRAVCTHEPNNYSSVVDAFPALINDERAQRSIEFYKQKYVDNFLGIETFEDEPEIYEEHVLISKTHGPYNPDGFSKSGLSEHYDGIELNSKLIELSLSHDRTLMQLKEEISKQLSNPKNPLTTEKLIANLVALIGTKKSERAFSDFFVASLRALGESDVNEALTFGQIFTPFLYDHRALRSLTIFHRREKQYEEALCILQHPNFQHDDNTTKWLEDLIARRRKRILSGKLKPKFQTFGNDFQSLTKYMGDIFMTLKDDPFVARYIYSYLREQYDIHDDAFLANEIIRWGEVINSLENKVPESNKIDSVSIENTKSFNRLSRELRRLENSVSLKLGTHLTRAVRNPLRLIVLPITMPILTIKLGLEKLGKIPMESTVVATNESMPRKHCIVLFPTNGVGFGHFTRMYAVARALRKADPELEIIFFTPMPTLHILYSDNFPTYHIAGRYKHSDMTARQWNGLIEEMLTLVFDTHSPKWFMFDGAFPYRGMLNAILAQPQMKKLWMKRGTSKKNKKIPANNIEMFDTVIRPQDISQEKPSRINYLIDELIVSPITLIEPHEMIEREQARAILSAPLDCKLVYVQLGAGRINDISSAVRLVVDALLEDQNVHIVLGESLLGERTMLGLERLHVIRDYPNALFLKAFDASVQAGGYNSFHEMRSVRMPTLFIPNTQTGMDDQYKRVMLSEKEGWGIVIKPSAKEISNGVQALLSMGSTEQVSMSNGASETANYILSN